MKKHPLFKIKHTIRFLVLVFVYTFILWVCLFLALMLRFDFDVPAEFQVRFWRLLPWVLALKLILLRIMGQYRSLLTFFSFPDAKKLVLALGTASFLLGFVWYISDGDLLLPRGVIVVDFVLSTTALVSLRLGMRTFRERLNSYGLSLDQSRKRIAIIGAGVAGAALAREIQSKPGLGLLLICFVDDNPLLVGQTLHGREVVGNRSQLKDIVQRMRIQKVILAMPTAKPRVIQATVKIINELGIDHEILPSIDQLLHRKVTVSHLRHVSPEDLLGREPVVLNDDAISGLIKGKVVLVTGAGGSIGSELCRQIASHAPRALLLVERSEPALFVIQQELQREFEWIKPIPLAASVCNKDRIQSIFQKYKPQIVFHAAAHKHVPLMEEQPAEAILNNAIGTMVVGEAAINNGCERFVLVSTDKAVNPTNVMGATKRLAELVVNGLQNGGGHGTKFCSVRFGNVLGSSGSVIPTFREQIARGGPVTVTHPEVTRYFMSIPEAVGLILQSASEASGGEVFVLDMGEPIRIQDLARQMIELCGFVPEEDIKIRFVGLRPGEKLYEEPIHVGENITKTTHPKISKLINDLNAAEILQETKEFAASRLYDLSQGELKAWLAKVVLEYKVWED